jgi:hypothetical protein
MKTNWSFCSAFVMALIASMILSATGCASPRGHSYNEDFSQSLPTDPKYFIENIDDDHFKLTIHQGSPVQGPQRIIDMKNAAPNIAEAEARRRGWDNWQLDYIQESNQGWMHILIAEITRKPGLRNPPDYSQPHL